MRAIGLVLAILLATAATAARAQAFTAAEIAGIDQGVHGFMIQRGVPSASVAVVRDGRIVFAKAYGLRALSPDRPATLEARYNLGSVAKQMTATALLMLVDEGKLSLDDTIDRWLPELTGASRITVRQVLSHTAGYRSFFISETPPIEGLKPTSPQAVADRWGRMPLDYEPGSKWDYSNTDYTIAALIVERISGQPLETVLRQRVFGPLGMTSAVVLHGRAPPSQDAQAYTRYALGPIRPAHIVGDGWALGAGGISMTATDLAKWDIGMLDHRLLSARSYAAQQTNTALSSGEAAPYGLGVFVDSVAGHKRVFHAGSESGFLTENRVYPNDKAAIVVTVNADFGDVQNDVANQIERLIFAQPAPPRRDPRRPRPNIEATVRPQDLALAHTLVDQLTHGTLDRSLLGPDSSHYFSPTAVADYRESLARLGEPIAFERIQNAEIAGQAVSIYRIMWANDWAAAILRRDPDGRVASFVIYAPV